MPHVQGAEEDLQAPRVQQMLLRKYSLELHPVNPSNLQADLRILLCADCLVVSDHRGHKTTQLSNMLSPREKQAFMEENKAQVKALHKEANALLKKANALAKLYKPASRMTSKTEYEVLVEKKRLILEQ